MVFGGGCGGNYVGKPLVNIRKQNEEGLKELDVTDVPVVVDRSVIPVVNYDVDKKVDEALSGCCGKHPKCERYKK